MPTAASSSAAPYLVASEPNVRFVSILTTGDALNPGGTTGRFAGTPDGIGAFDNGDGTFTMLVNHEFSGGEGTVRDHGSIGSFIDRIVIDKTTLQVVSGDDLIKNVQLWNDATDSHFAATTIFSRFCSSDLASSSAFYDAATGLGTQTRIYLTGEESGSEGRAFGILVNGDQAGTAFELPSLGNLSFENLTANPFAQTKTIVAATDDGTDGQVYIYIGEKQATGTTLEQAGLSGGSFYGIKVAGFADETNNTAPSGTFTLQEIGPDGDASNLTGLQINAESEAEGVTSFLRPEDSAWDPDQPNVLYFATTNSFNGNSRLYKATFADITNPTAGGTIEAVLDGSEGQRMFDNITVGNGKVILQEDPGGNPRLAKVWEYDIATDRLTEIAQHDPALFAPGARNLLTTNEESSGVLDVTSLLGDANTRAYLLDVQAHYDISDPALVEGGQLLAMFVDKPQLIGSSADDNLFGSAADETFEGYSGNDTIHAGSGNDVLNGGDGNDTLYGGNDDDTLFGDAGNDVLYGDDGNDKLYGGADDDALFGGNGADTLFGDDGNDKLYGGDGFDVLHGGNGADTLYGGAGNDVLYGDDGYDRLFGGDDYDTLYGGNGNDVLFGEDGNDTLYGGNDYDVLIGGNGNDKLYGEAGNDTLWGGAGDDDLYGGSGLDRFLFNSTATNGVDTIHGFKAEDKLVFFTDDGYAADAGFTAGTSAVGAGAQFVYDARTGALYYDADGAGGAAAIKLATILDGTVHAGDILITAGSAPAF